MVIADTVVNDGRRSPNKKNDSFKYRMPFSLFGKSKQQKEKEAAAAAAAQQLAKNRKGQIMRRLYSGPRDEYETEVWKTPEEWAQENATKMEGYAKQAAEQQAAVNAQKKAMKNAEIARCRQVVAEANAAEANAMKGGKRTKKYRKNKNKNTRRKH